MEYARISHGITTTLHNGEARPCHKQERAVLGTHRDCSAKRRGTITLFPERKKQEETFFFETAGHISDGVTRYLANVPEMDGTTASELPGLTSTTRLVSSDSSGRRWLKRARSTQAHAAARLCVGVSPGFVGVKIGV